MEQLQRTLIENLQEESLETLIVYVLDALLSIWGEQNALYAELVAAMMAIEIAHINGFSNFWLEADSQLVILAFKSFSIVPWVLRNRWLDCLVRIMQMSFLVSHIYREGNACAGSLANVGLALTSSDLFWSEGLPDSIRGEYNRNRLGMPNFRFTTF